MFLDYISDVLPNLGVTGVQTQTYLFWAKSILDWDDSYMISPKEENLQFKEFKGSKEFIDILDEYFDRYEEQLFDNIPYSRKEDVRERYQYLQKTSPQISFLEKLDLSLEYAFAQRDFDEGRLGLMDSTQEFRMEKRKDIRKYFNKNTNPFQMYKNLFKTDLISKDISKYSLDGIKKEGKIHLFRMEDIAPILYLFFKLVGTDEFKHDYIVVDEAQDLSLIQIQTLFQVAKNNNITLAGDLAQSIIPPFYIKDWEMVLDIFKEAGIENYSYHQLNRCYRTTVEIIEFANKIFKQRFPKNYKLPEAVLRHGDEVLHIETNKEIINGDIQDIKGIANILNDHFKEGAATCAIVCRDRDYAGDVVKVFKKYQELFNREIVSFEEVDYKTGIQVLPIEKAKGLEFDTVVLVDLDNIRYEDTELNTRLLYVGITRALHHLVVTKSSQKAISPLLENVL
jgi:DNA helicase-2/ATP-dependent DNA helicase PcrA